MNVAGFNRRYHLPSSLCLWSLAAYSGRAQKIAKVSEAGREDTIKLFSPTYGRTAQAEALLQTHETDRGLSPSARARPKGCCFHGAISLPSAGFNVNPSGHSRRGRKFVFQRERTRTANWRQRLQRAFANSTFYKWEFCLPERVARELKPGSRGGSYRGCWPSSSRLLRKRREPQEDVPRCRGPQSSLPSAAHPGPDPPEPQPRGQGRAAGKEQGSSCFGLRGKRLPTQPKLLHVKEWSPAQQ